MLSGKGLDAVFPVIMGRLYGVICTKCLCGLCRLGKLGDDSHYLFEFSHFKLQKQTCLPVYFRLRPNVYKMEKLFNTKNIVKVRKLAKFYKEIVYKRGYVICWENEI